jgi:GDPmannose 4,6-dehydratase
MPRALITGITGQDGSYLAEHLLSLGYDVFGMVRGQNNPRRAAVERLLPAVRLIDADLLDEGSIIAALRIAQPDEVYNLAAISFVPMSWGQADLTAQTTGLGVLRVLDAIRAITGASPSRSTGAAGVRLYQASSSEMFGRARETPQNEQTPFYPRSPYGVSKTFGHYITVNYRESYGMFACGGILFNHESPRRGAEFVTRKITLAAARIKAGLQSELLMGNLDAKRDWGFAGDYVRSMHLMLQQPEPDDYVIGTGETHSVREFVDLAFARAGLDPERYLRIDPQLVRPAEVDVLLADAGKARRVLGWRPTVGFSELVEMMVDADMAAIAGTAAARPPATRRRARRAALGETAESTNRPDAARAA